jgi:hypothetical protein
MPRSARAAGFDAAPSEPCAWRGPGRFDAFRGPRALGKFLHRRDPIFLDHRGAPGGGRAALYSVAAFDLDDGPVVVTLPHPGRRDMTLTAMDDRHALQAVFHGPGGHTLDRDRVGTRRVTAVFCLMLDLARHGELAAAQGLQDAITFVQRTPQAHWSAFQAPIVL